ncbi:IclR family transcriptional regulator [Halobacteria archaeon AArc-curdl1]|uniref:IclR family transcriptional regulator n=1 Tax=Natronosalvus hydrolyticus TaxID=2979988 RepID=A0AAP3E5E6_9EURY|nr:IclR family transcriptional regulator [Halobacteria archaeon AArc-curdl1]
MSGTSHHVKSVRKLFRIIEALERHEMMGVTELARETGIAKSSVYKYLDTLQYLGFVTKTETSYALSLRWYEIGRGVRERRAVFQTARSELDRLARQTGETISLVVEEDSDAVYLLQLCERERPAAPVEEGSRIPIPISVGGKAILSYRPIKEVEAVLAHHELTDQSDQLISELQTLRNQRMVIERESPSDGKFSAGSFMGHRHVVGHGEPYQNLHSVAVPIRDADSYAVAAIEVSGSKESLYGQRLEDEIARLLVNASKSIETVLQSQ